MKKVAQLEGSGGTMLAQVIGSLGYNKGIGITFGTITSAPPEIKMKVDGAEAIELDKDDITIALHLTKRKERIKITSTNVNVNMTAVDSHTHDVTDIVMEEAEIEYLDELKVGDRVFVIESEDEQSYVILDKLVRY